MLKVHREMQLFTPSLKPALPEDEWAKRTITEALAVYHSLAMEIEKGR